MPSLNERVHDGMAKLAARSPRLAGALLLAMGVAFAGVNLALIVWTETFYGAFFILAGGLIPLGGFIIATGIVSTPIPERPKPPLWWTVTSTTLSVIGVLIGLYLTFALGK